MILVRSYCKLNSHQIEKLSKMNEGLVTLSHKRTNNLNAYLRKPVSIHARLSLPQIVSLNRGTYLFHQLLFAQFTVDEGPADELGIPDEN